MSEAAPARDAACAEGAGATVAFANDIARSVWRKMADVSDRRERRAPLEFAAARSLHPTVYFLTPDHAAPSGGIRVIYRHVDILNACRIPAAVLHRRRGFRCTWFEHETRITDVGAVTVARGDLLVVPEVDVEVLERVPPGISRVIFNQNSHLTWRHAAGEVARFYAPGPDLAAVVCVSDHNRQMLRQAFPDCPVRRVHLGIDPELFAPGDEPRPRLIAYMPRRGQDDARQVLAMLEARGVLASWEIVALDGLPHGEVAARLKRARIFLAFTRQEGFGLPAAEAMACGCYVVGNDGFGGREFFRPGCCARVENGDVAGFAAAVETAVLAERGDPGWCAARGRRAARFVLQEYSLQRERDEVAALYAGLLGDAALRR